MTIRHLALQLGAATLAAAAAALPALPALAQDAYPGKPITMLVPFPPGGVADTVGRPVAEAMARALGQPMPVENKGGAGGGIGMAQVAKARPDGYNVLMSLSSVVVLPEADKVLSVVWRLALEKSDAAYADERSRLDQARIDMAAAVTQAQERAAEFEREALSLQGERQALQARLQANQAEIEDLRQRLSDTTTLLRARDEQIGQMPGVLAVSMVYHQIESNPDEEA